MTGGLSLLLLVAGVDDGAAPAPTYDADYQAVLDRATTLGYTLPSLADREKQNTLLLAFKSSGAWAKSDTIHVGKYAGSVEFSTLNWKNPLTHQITVVNAITWSNTAGWTGNSTDAYLDLNYNPATQGVNWTQNSAGVSAWVEANVSGNIISGRSTNAGRFSTGSTSQQRINQGTANLDSAAGKNDVGLFGIYRTSSTNVEVFANDTQYSRTATSAAVTSSNVYLLRSGTTYSGSTLGAALCGDQLVSENATLKAALAAYMA